MDKACNRCANSDERNWFNSTDDFSGLAEKPMAFLCRALTFGIDYVSVLTASTGCHSENCDCTSCEWLADACLLVHEYTEVSFAP